MTDGRIIEGDILDSLALVDDESVDAIVTDPPYELNFMGKKWDGQGISFQTETWEVCMRVLKPGGHMIVFGGTRTHHHMWVAVEDAGFEVRDMLTWIHGQGFPKSLDVSKAIDRRAGAERETLGLSPNRRKSHEKGGSWKQTSPNSMSYQLTAPATDAAKEWDGWGTGLKPSVEPILLARKPLSEKTVAANVLKWGTGAINIDVTRLESGRWPANVMLQCTCDDSQEESGFIHQSDCPVGMLDSQSGKSKSPKPYIYEGKPEAQQGAAFGMGLGRGYHSNEYADSGGASRFFYCPKASKKERGKDNTHPTVKPLALMRWLIRLVTPPNGVVLDPFCGSGSTLVAAADEGIGFIGVDVSEEYCAIARTRLGKGPHGQVD